MAFEDSNIAAARSSTSADGFPEEMEYVLSLEGRPEVSLHLVRNRLLGQPDVYRQTEDGGFSLVPDQTKPKVSVLYSCTYLQCNY